MKHKVRISVTESPPQEGLVTYKCLNVRERILKFLIGEKRRVTVLIPGDNVGEIAITEVKRGEENNG